ncbi:MAG: leucine-rich repeat protein [Clostridia bacterium]|nr:leucine-rich repeat protein [Clostridia bacterium]
MKRIRLLSLLLALLLAAALLPSCKKSIKEPEGHDFTLWTVEKEPTYKKKGVLTRSCKDEGCTFSQSVKVKCAKGLSYEEDLDGKIYITGIGSFDGEFLYIADQTPKGQKVSGIAEQAFMDEPGIRYAYIEDGVNVLHDYTFTGCENLLEVRLPEACEIMGVGHFLSCRTLKRINLPDKMTEIPMQFFDGCEELSRIDLPESLETIGFSAFNLCLGLTEISLPQGLKRIERDAFSACHNLKAIVFPDGLESIMDSAFVGCLSLSEVVLPEGLVELRELAFAHCSGLKKVYIPSSVQGIYVNTGFSPFNYCSKDLKLITDAESRPQGWSEHFNVYYAGQSETADPVDGYEYLEVLYGQPIPKN